MSVFAKYVSTGFIVCLLAGCTTSIKGEKYLLQKPAIDLQNFFNGEVLAWGIVQNRRGDVVQRFKVDITGSMRKGVLTLDERFHYLQGEGLTQRIWDIQSIDKDRFTGNASDIEGSAEGVRYGNALNWRYEMDLLVKGKTYRVAFDDWMWMLGEDALINRAYIRKFGLVMAEVTLFMKKQ